MNDELDHRSGGSWRGPGLQVGLGRASGHHGELLQGVFESPLGSLHRGLVTFPCPLFESVARFQPGALPAVTVYPTNCVKARSAAVATLGHIGAPSGGHLMILRTALVGKGLGSSTTDVVAAIRSVAEAYGARLSESETASLAVRSEVASDSVMCEGGPVLFGQRTGVVLEQLGQRLPALEVLGFDREESGGECSTLARPPARYDSQEIEVFRVLLGALRHAVRHYDSRLLCRVATASARINQRYLPMPMFAEINRIAEHSGAAGVQIAHSGTVVGLLFECASHGRLEQLTRIAIEALSSNGIGAFWRFSSRDAPFGWRSP